VRRAAAHLIRGAVAALLFSSPCWPDSPDGTGPPVPDASVGSVIPNPNLPERHWYEKLPFLPVPDIGHDPNSGLTAGILPVWLKTDDQQHIRRIIAPDLIYNPNFGVGVDGRIYDYPSEDEQWSLEGGLKEHVERHAEGEYQLGRLRQENWSFVGSVIYDRSGSSRFFGFGNHSLERDQTNFTNQQQLVQAQIGYNFTHSWQLLYTARFRAVDVLPGTLSGIPSIQQLFPNVPGLGTHYEQLNRLSIIYDTRDDLTAPRQGMAWVVYGGVASHEGIFNDSLYSEAGVDGRAFLPLNDTNILATHVSLRYLPSYSHPLPFWALSSIGGGESVVGGVQPLRGYGEGRFYDRNGFSGTAELRHTLFTFDAISHIEIELAPFVDVGDVFHHASSFPIQGVHKVAGVGFRAIARPSVVGYVDVGYGSEGAAVFTGINYPF
jgi:Omp85 superfamily domain